MTTTDEDEIEAALASGEVHKAAESTEERLNALTLAFSAQERRLSGMLIIAGNLRRSRDPGKAMRAIVAEISALLFADRTTIYELRPGDNMLWGLAVEGEASVEVGLPVGEGIAGLVAARNKALNLKDAYRHPAFDAKYDKLTGYQTRSMLCVPMRDYQNECIGVVQVLNKRDGYFTVEDEALLTALSEQAAITLEALHLQVRLNIRNTELRGLSEELKQRVKELEFLYSIEQATNEAKTPRALAEAILQRTAEVARVAIAAIFLADENANANAAGPAFYRSARPDDELVVVERLAVGEGILGPLQGRVKVEDVITTPLVVGGAAIGSLCLINRRNPSRRDNNEDQRLAVLIAGQLATAFSTVERRRSALVEDRMKTIGQMMSSVLHDLKGPMAIISGYSQLIATVEDPDTRREMSEAIHRQVAAFNDMSREVMDFARGERTVLARRVYLHKFIRQLEELIKPEFAEHEVDFVVENQCSEGLAYFDEAKMLRVVTNIARNARQAMQTGGRFVWRIRDKDDGGLIFELSDNGPGIPEAIHNELFDAFTTSGKPGGTGLGLTIVRRIVEDHGGTVSFETEGGRGTTFTITLPPAPS